MRLPTKKKQKRRRSCHQQNSSRSPRLRDRHIGTHRLDVEGPKWSPGIANGGCGTRRLGKGFGRIQSGNGWQKAQRYEESSFQKTFHENKQRKYFKIKSIPHTHRYTHRFGDLLLRAKSPSATHWPGTAHDATPTRPSLRPSPAACCNFPNANAPLLHCFTQ